MATTTKLQTLVNVSLYVGSDRERLTVTVQHGRLHALSDELARIDARPQDYGKDVELYRARIQKFIDAGYTHEMSTEWRSGLRMKFEFVRFLDDRQDGWLSPSIDAGSTLREIRDAAKELARLTRKGELPSNPDAFLALYKHAPRVEYVEGLHLISPDAKRKAG